MKELIVRIDIQKSLQDHHKRNNFATVHYDVGFDNNQEEEEGT